MLRAVLLVVAGVSVSLPALASGYCFSLFDAKNKLVRQTSEPLVDMSRPIAPQVDALFPGHFLIVAPGSNCTEIDESGRGQITPYDGAQREPSDSPILLSAQREELRVRNSASSSLGEPTSAGRPGAARSGTQTYSAPMPSNSSTAGYRR
jgi:hypothetical protein